MRAVSGEESRVLVHESSVWPVVSGEEPGWIIGLLLLELIPAGQVLIKQIQL